MQPRGHRLHRLSVPVGAKLAAADSYSPQEYFMPPTNGLVPAIFALRRDRAFAENAPDFAHLAETMLQRGELQRLCLALLPCPRTLCNQLPQSCLGNQLKDLYNADMARVAAGQTPQYFISRYGGGGSGGNQVGLTVYSGSSAMKAVQEEGRTASLDRGR